MDYMSKDRKHHKSLYKDMKMRGCIFGIHFLDENLKKIL